MPIQTKLPPEAPPSPPWHRWLRHVDDLAAAIGLRAGQPIPPAVDEHARLILLDTLGCAFAGRTASEVAALEHEAARREPGPFRFPGGPDLGLRPAVQLLAIGPTWHEACEGHAHAHGRPGIATIAALLPLALVRGASLGELMDALALGYEVGARAGGWLRIRPGLHVDGNWPALGVAAGVARLIGLDAPATMRAVNIAACQLPASLYLPIRTGRSVRNTYLAHSASLGLDAALAAQAGFDAPPDALACYAEEHCQATIEPLPPPDAHLILDAYLKPFAAVRHVHYGAIAAQRIRARLGGDTAGIRGIVLEVYEEATIYCDNPRPATLLAAQFSLTFGVAAMLRTGAVDATTYEPAVFDDHELRRLESLVEVRVDPELTGLRQRGARLTVATDAARLTERVAHDDPALLPTPAQARDKFVRNLAGSLDDERARAFFDAMRAAPRHEGLDDLWRRLSAA
ncbi:MAG: MmgE/PrpD family protein [Burkholderiaceae bacterium]|nr:MmgE/PrpD family protein [Burkholderiaceae bacterium]